MSGTPKKGGADRAPGNKSKPDIQSIEAFLDEIEKEESKLNEQLSSMPSSYDMDDDDLGDLNDDIEAVKAPKSSSGSGRSGSCDSFDDDFDDDLEPSEEYLDSLAKKRPAPASVREESKPATGQSGRASLKEKILGDGKEKKSQLMPLIIIILLIVIIIILLLQNCGSCSGEDKPNTDDWYDTTAIEGTLPGKTPEEIQAMLNQIVEEGMFNVSIAPVIVFENPQAAGQARIENVPANHYNMSVAITLDETSETIYESKGIRPGQYIEYITLQKELQPGEHNATAMFTAYDADDLSVQGHVAVKIRLIVE